MKKALNAMALACAVAMPWAATAAPPGTVTTSSVKASGKTLATSQLATDVLNKIAGYSQSSHGCANLSSVRMDVMPRNYVPVQPSMPASARGGHFEQWTVDACGFTQRFQVGMWPSPNGGADFAVTPIVASRVPSAGAPMAPASSAPLSSWHGRYVWEEALGRIGGAKPSEGAAAFITHTLVLGPSAGGTGCRLDGEGYQTDTHLQCTATPQGESVLVKFYRFAPNNARGRYAVGAPLLTMSRSPAGIVTRLQELGPATEGSPRTGRMFVAAR